ncbi:hypothetical protein [Neolewinella agarilytica]|uniref:hypothetical protein n=1 Tax=Neolewinella agarilytica TaxID=478744 RepID=UPI002354E042|nr:hypothetical protein [Neolewinella agarilytica]
MIAKLPSPVLIWLLALLALSGCEPDVTDSSMVMEERFQDRTQALTAKIMNDCHKDVLEAATLRADSLLINRARRMQRIEGRPPRPNRPGAPPPKALSAPLPLRPLFPFEIRYDTLLQQQLLQDSLRSDSISRGLPDVNSFSPE